MDLHTGQGCSLFPHRKTDKALGGPNGSSITDMLQLEAEQDENEEDERETAPVRPEDPQMPTALQLSKENISVQSREDTAFKLKHWNAKMDLQVKTLGDDHMGWGQQVNNIIQKINVTESTMKSLLSKVLSLKETQIEEMDFHRDLDPDQGASIEEKIMKIKKQLGEMDNKLVQADVCNEAQQLEDKLTERGKNFCKDVTLINRNWGKFQKEEQKTGADSPGEVESLPPQALLPPLVENSPPHFAVWKCALRICILFCVLIFTGLVCYIFFLDPTFIFEKTLPRMLGHRRMWELRDIISPFLYLEVEDLLPS